jgi:hypothetical protein
MAANSMRTLDREMFEAGVLSLLAPSFGTDLEEPPTRDESSKRHLGEHQGFDPQTFVRLVRVLDRVGSKHEGSR